MVTTMLVRFKYYHAWIFADAICNNSGFGFNGYDKNGEPKWDLASNVDVYGFEVNFSKWIMNDYFRDKSIYIYTCLDKDRDKRRYIWDNLENRWIDFDVVFVNLNSVSRASFRYVKHYPMIKRIAFTI